MLPARLVHNQAGYDIYPTHNIGPDRITLGYSAIAAQLTPHRCLVVDGYAGADWEQFRQQMTACWQRLGITSAWFDVASALRHQSERDTIVGRSLEGDDPLFGRACTASLEDFFDPAELARLKPDNDASISILYGVGAELAGWAGTLVYVDLPKNEIQFRARAGRATCIGETAPASAKAAYRHNYFVDWPVLNRHKQRLLPGIDLLIDGQRGDEPTAISGDDLRLALDNLSHNLIRARPWFEPGAWGGHWMAEHLRQLPADVPNYAWSFELISPENGIILESSGVALEVTFDTLMFHDAAAVLGESASRFGVEFPIRFDFLDTFDGGNLSLQVHPRPSYIQENFGERFTQDETYYILDAAPGSQVFLGFQADINRDDFAGALQDSAITGQPIDITRFVQEHPAHKHDLFLIPHGTIHASGVGNLVLEISSTPYIFTFKLYDWVRPDLDGRPRPLNIARGLANLDFDRRGETIAAEFISHPKLIATGDGWRLSHLPTHRDHFYDVHRIELDAGASYALHTNDSVQVVSLVDGPQIDVQTGQQTRQFCYAETFIVPAGANVATFRAEAPVKLVIASIKPGRGPL